MDTDLIKILADIGAGGLSLLLITRQGKLAKVHGKILENHEERITVLEAARPRPRKRRR